MPDDPKTDPDDTGKDDQPATGDDPNSGAKKALDAERKARRDAERKSKDLEDRLKAIEDKDKSEVERLTEQLAEAQKSLSTVTVERDRLTAAINKGLTEDHAKRVLGGARRISGESAEDLDADAEDYFSTLGPLAVGEEKKDPPPGGKPREQLKPGSGDPDAPVEETDVKTIGARMFQR